MNLSELSPRANVKGRQPAAEGNGIQMSVVIPCYNSSSTIECLLAGVTVQTLSPKLYEVIVVDDGSIDNTCEIVQNFSGVRLVRQQRQGPGIARTLGANVARGKYVLFIDSDLAVSADLLEQHLMFHLRNPYILATGGSVLPFGERPLFSWALVDHLSTWFNVHPGVACNDSAEYFPGLNFCINKHKAMDEQGVTWHAGLEHTGEDVIFCYDIRKKGALLAFVREAIVKHRDRTSMQAHLYHMYRFGHHGPFVRGKLPGLRYGFLFPKSLTKTVLFLPFIILGYTFLIWRYWLNSRPVEVTLSLPQIFLGRLAYACGVVRGTWDRMRQEACCPELQMDFVPKDSKQAKADVTTSRKSGCHVV